MTVDEVTAIASSALFLVALLAFFTVESKGTKLRGKALVREIVICGAITAATVAVVYYLFSVLLGVRLPGGLWR